MVNGKQAKKNTEIGGQDKKKEAELIKKICPDCPMTQKRI